MMDMTDMTGAEATQAVKVALRTAFPASKFAVTIRRRMIQWTDDGPTVEQVQDALVAAGCGEFRSAWNGERYVRLRGENLWFDRYNAAERIAEEAERERRVEESKQRQERENAAVRAAELAKRERERGPSPAGTLVCDHAQEQACAAFEELRQRAERDVATDTERQHRPSWAPPLIIDGELLENCIARGLLTADDKPIARLWATFADPKKPGRVLREHNAPHGMPDISCRGFQLHAGGERGPTSAILFEAQRAASGAWRFGPSSLEGSYYSPRRHEWERLVRERERAREFSPSDVARHVPRLDAQIAALDAEDLAAAKACHHRAQLHNRAVELGRDRVLDFAGAPGVQMQLAGQLWGHCFNCGKVLTDPISRERGIGPDCFEGKLAFIRLLAAQECDVAVIAYIVGMPTDFVETIIAGRTSWLPLAPPAPRDHA